jgi:tagatose 1,6-diphosphate aldolase
MAFVKGTSSCKGDSAYTREEAKDYFREAAAAARKPFIYLSAGVSNPIFVETLELAADSGAPFNGVLCGRASWQDGIAVFAKQGSRAFEDWLNTTGVENIMHVNDALRHAHSWYGKVQL